ncbi:MAG TPA: hypothetical protein VGR45_05360 [Stellaceae bacterium]|nr:hypothetical protein [Stellaceae bacterium]
MSAKSVGNIVRNWEFRTSADTRDRESLAEAVERSAELAITEELTYYMNVRNACWREEKLIISRLAIERLSRLAIEELSNNE